MEAIRRNKFQSFFQVLKSPINDPQNPGCGLKYIAKSILEQYQIENKRMNVLEVRLIGSQAINLAQYGFRLVDSLWLENSTEAELIKFYALSLICTKLRDIGGLMNRVKVNQSYVDDLSKICKIYFNLFALYFPTKCQSTVWTLGYVVPFHAGELYENYKIGFGVLSMQGKESLHSSLKQQLRNETNRSKDENSNKWHQIMRSSFVRTFYLPYHFPIPPQYHSHYRSRRAFVEEGSYCDCSRELKDRDDGVCSMCHESGYVLESAIVGKMSENIVKALKPIECSICKERFSDVSVLNHHEKIHSSHGTQQNPKTLIPQKMSVTELKKALKDMNKSTTGNKDVLCRRLEGLL